MKVENIPEGRLYGDLTYLIPLLSPPEEYAEEATHWRSILREKLAPGRHPILELGVGGGHNLSHLTNDFEATAVDLSETMLTLCRTLNPGVELHQGDMRTVRLGRKFSAVLIHDAICYMQTEADLRAAFATAAAHLDAGGVLITGGDHYLETFTSPRVETYTHSYETTELTYFEYTYDPDPQDTSIEAIIYYFIRKQGDLQIECDRHVMGLFPRQAWIDWMREAGFQVEERVFALSKDWPSYTLFVGTLEG
jgi:trans-aconitate methyltransferase